MTRQEALAAEEVAFKKSLAASTRMQEHLRTSQRRSAWWLRLFVYQALAFVLLQMGSLYFKKFDLFESYKGLVLFVVGTTPLYVIFLANMAWDRIKELTQRNIELIDLLDKVETGAHTMFGMLLKQDETIERLVQANEAHHEEGEEWKKTE